MSEEVRSSWSTDPTVEEAPWPEDEPPFEMLSLCVECCKHPALKHFVNAHAVEGLACAICVPTKGFARACAIEQRQEMMNLLAGLVRFYFEEFEYNSHWGADESVEDLLTRPNPILETENSLFNRRTSRNRAHELLYWLFSDNPYPEPGISVYAGSDDDGGRHLARSIQQTLHPTLQALRARLLKQNHFDVEAEVFSLLDGLEGRVDGVVGVGSRLFRARTGVQGEYQKIDSGWKPEVRDRPYTGKDISAPPPPLASPGRLNRTGTSFLYLASDAPTAAAEIRPHPGHKVSVGQFECIQPLRIASFNADIAAFTKTESDLDLFHFVHSIDTLMSEPIVPEAAARYSVTQLIADCLRRRGFDGVSYRSSVGGGDNLCIFKPAAFRYVEGSGAVLSVKSLNYGLEDAPSLIVDDPDYSLIHA